MTQRKRRPAGLTVASLLLAWVSVGALLNVALWSFAVRLFGEEDLSASPLLADLMAWLTGNAVLLIGVAVLYAVFGIASAIGAWRVAPWTPVPFALWALFALAFGGLGFDVGVAEASLGARVALLAVFAAVLLAGFLYLRRATRSRPPERAQPLAD